MTDSSYQQNGKQRNRNQGKEVEQRLRFKIVWRNRRGLLQYGLMFSRLVTIVVFIFILCNVAYAQPRQTPPGHEKRLEQRLTEMERRMDAIHDRLDRLSREVSELSSKQRDNDEKNRGRYDGREYSQLRTELNDVVRQVAVLGERMEKEFYLLWNNRDNDRHDRDRKGHDKVESYNCYLKTPFNTFYAEGKSKAEATAKVLKQCEDSGSSLWAKPESVVCDIVSR